MDAILFRIRCIKWIIVSFAKRRAWLSMTPQTTPPMSPSKLDALPIASCQDFVSSWSITKLGRLFYTVLPSHITCLIAVDLYETICIPTRPLDSCKQHILFHKYLITFGFSWVLFLTQGIIEYGWDSAISLWIDEPTICKETNGLPIPRPFVNVIF